MLDILFLVTAVIGSAIMVCQFAMSLMGLGGEAMDGGHGDVGGHDMGVHDAGSFDLDHHGAFHGDAASGHVSAHAGATSGDASHPDSSWLFGVLTFRTLTAAAAFFGVAGATAKSAGMSSGAALAIAAGVGLAAMYGVFWLMRAVVRLNSSGNERISSAIGRPATVYIPIPPDRKGAGKVQLSMQNRIVEFQAVTDEPQQLRTGEKVQVVAIAGSDVVHVRRVAAVVQA